MSRLFLVTGGSRGLGRGICANLMRQIKASGSKDSLVMCVRKGFQESTLTPEERDFMNIIPMDVTSDEEVKKCALIVEGIYKDKSHQSATLINNAGLGDDLNWKGCSDPNAVDRVLSVNVTGLHQVTTTFLPLLKQATEGKSRVINISSGASQQNISRSSEPIQKVLLSQEGLSWDEISEMMTNFTQEYKESLAKGGEHPNLSQRGYWLQSYGFSKALVNAYSIWLSKQHPSLVVHCCTPGFVLTDMVSDYSGDATLLSVDQGVQTPCFLALGGADDIPTSFFREKKVCPWAPSS